MEGMENAGSGNLHPILTEASRGELPPWSRASQGRRAHMIRVASLLEGWGRKRGEGEGEVARWKAAGHLHDALRDADPEKLRPLVDEPFRDLPGKALHGPAVAARLRAEGVGDEEFLHALTYHTLGSADFGSLGMALYAADFLEPGRRLREGWRKTLRQRAARDLEGVAKEILSARIGHLLDENRPLRKETVAFWNAMAEGRGWASASEV
jgi:2-amino-4-hydroxy-6-hydroxymethyldihydropteridine diphosphokinase